MKAIDVFSHWGEARTLLVEAVQTLQDSDLAYTPGGGLRSIGENVAHIGQGEDFWCSRVVDQPMGVWDAAEDPQLATVSGLLRRLDELHQKTLGHLSALEASALEEQIETRRGPRTKHWVFWHIIEHEVHHRGEVFFAMGIHGTPPPGF